MRNIRITKTCYRYLRSLKQRQQFPSIERAFDGPCLQLCSTDLLGESRRRQYPFRYSLVG